MLRYHYIKYRLPTDKKGRKMRYYRFDGYLIAKMQEITTEQAQEASEEMRYDAYRKCLKRCGDTRPCSTRTMKRWFGIDGYHKPGREQLIKLFFALGLTADQAEEWLVQGALEPGFQINDLREFFMIYCLEQHFTYEKCQKMIEMFMEQMSPDIPMEQHHETGKMWEAYRQNCDMAEEQFVEFALSMQKYFKGYSMTVLEYFRDLKDEILGYLRKEYESLLETTLAETSYYQWQAGRKLFGRREKTSQPDPDHVRQYLRACETGKAQPPSDDMVGRIKEYIHILERSCDSNAQLLENLYPDREDIGAPEGSRMQRGEIRIMDDKYLSEILNVGMQKERELQLMLEGADGRRLQEQRKRCRIIDRHDLLPLIFEVAQRRYLADNTRRYCKEEAREAFALLADQILTACNMPGYQPEKYELDTILDVCFGETGMLSLYDIILEYQGWE